MTITYEWRGEFANAAVNALHAEGFDHPDLGIDWHTQVHRHESHQQRERDQLGARRGWAHGGVRVCHGRHNLNTTVKAGCY